MIGQLVKNEGSKSRELKSFQLISPKPIGHVQECLSIDLKSIIPIEIVDKL